MFEHGLNFSWFCMFFVTKSNSIFFFFFFFFCDFYFLFYSTVAGVVACGGRTNSSRISSWCRLYFISFEIIEPILTILKIEHRLGGAYSLANYSIAYEETLSNRVSDFRDFLCSLFPKAIIFLLFFLLSIFGRMLLLWSFVSAFIPRGCRRGISDRHFGSTSGLSFRSRNFVWSFGRPDILHHLYLRSRFRIRRWIDILIQGNPYRVLVFLMIIYIVYALLQSDETLECLL